jgi:hypothetical protein
MTECDSATHRVHQGILSLPFKAVQLLSLLSSLRDSRVLAPPIIIHGLAPMATSFRRFTAFCAIVIQTILESQELIGS